MEKQMKYLVLIVGLAGFVAMIGAPIASADPYDPTCLSWQSDCQWQQSLPYDGAPGTWSPTYFGPHWYTPCTGQRSCAP
jgi:hypothetical protein